MLATAAGAEGVYWLLGSAAPDHFAEARTPDDVVNIVRTLPSNHSPEFAPTIEPTISDGVKALMAAAGAWLEPTS